MSGVAIALQGVLSLLLVAALAYGVRLERKLRDLRAGQEGFAKAVGDLDRAAARAEAGLESLRRSTDKADAALADRIDDARGLAKKLEQLTSDAALAVKRLENANTRLPQRETLGEYPEGGRGLRAERAEETRYGALPRAFGATPPPLRATSPSLRSGEDAVETPRLIIPEPSPADKLRQVAEMLRGSPPPPAKAAGARR